MTKRSVKPVDAERTELIDNSLPPFGPTDEGPVKRRTLRHLAKSADPAYTKFTTYIRKATHIGVKTRLVSKEKELSDLVEELLSNWLKDNDAVTM